MHGVLLVVRTQTLRVDDQLLTVVRCMLSMVKRVLVATKIITRMRLDLSTC